MGDDVWGWLEQCRDAINTNDEAFLREEVDRAVEYFENFIEPEDFTEDAVLLSVVSREYVKVLISEVDELTADHEADIQNLMDEIEQLEAKVGAPLDSQVTNEELALKQAEIERLTLNLEQAESELYALKDKEDEMKLFTARAQRAETEAKRKTEDLEKANATLEADNESLKEQVVDLRKHVRELNENLEGDTAGVKAKDAMIADLQGKLMDALAKKDTLAEEVENVSAALEAAHDMFKRKLASMADAESNLIENSRRCDELESMNSSLQAQVESLKRERDALAASDEDVMKMVSAKFEEVKRILTAKELALLRKEEEATMYEERIKALEQDLRDASLDNLKATISDKDELIANLNAELNMLRDQAHTWNDDADVRHEKFKSLKEEARAAHALEFEQLKDELRVLKEDFRLCEVERAEAKEALAAKSEELLDTRSRLLDMQSGVPQLPKAMSEIARLKEQLASRHAELQDTVRTLNDVQREKDYLEEENMVYRETYGPLNRDDIEEVVTAKDREIQKLKGLLAQYREDIDELEEEVLDYKAEIRLGAVERGIRAAELGLDPEDVVAEDNYARKSRRRGPRSHEVIIYQNSPERHAYDEREDPNRSPGRRGTPSRGGGGNGDIDLTAAIEKISDLSAKYAQAKEQLRTAQADSDRLEATVESLRKENAELSDGMSLDLDRVVAEINKQLGASPVSSSPGRGNTSGDSGSPAAAVSNDAVTALAISEALGKASKGGDASSTASGAESPQLNKIIELWTRKVDMRTKLRSRDDEVEKLAAETKNLRHELREERYQSGVLQDSLERATKRAAALDRDCEQLKARLRTQMAFGGGAGGGGGGVAAPSILTLGSVGGGADEYGLSTTLMSDDAIAEIAALNDQLVFCLEELGTKEREIHALERDLEVYRGDMAAIVDQKRLLYKEKVADEQAWQAEREALQSQLQEVQAASEVANVWKDEFESLQESLKSGDEKEALVEANRKIIVLRINEKALTRRYNNMRDAEAHALRSMKELEERMSEMELVTKEEIEYLKTAHADDVAALEKLQSEAEASVPKKDLEEAEAQLTRVCTKFQELMIREQELVVRAADAAKHKAENAALTERIAVLEGKIGGLETHNGQLLSDISELQTLQSAAGDKRGGSLIKQKYERIAEAQHELRSLRVEVEQKTRQGEMLTGKVERLTESTATLEALVAEQDEKLLALTKLNEETERALSELRRSTKESLPAAEAKDLRKSLRVVQDEVKMLRQERASLKRRMEVSAKHMDALKAAAAVKDSEITTLHAALRELQMRDDDASALGRMNLESLQNAKRAQVKGDLAASYEAENKRLAVQLQAAEREIDTRARQVFVIRQAATERTRELQERLAKLRHQFQGSMSMEKAEQLSLGVRQLEKDKQTADAKAVSLQASLLTTTDELEATKLQLAQTKELVRALQGEVAGGDTAATLSQWSEEVTALKIEKLRLNRRLARAAEDAAHAAKLARQQEDTIARLEEQTVMFDSDKAHAIEAYEHKLAELEAAVEAKERERETVMLALRSEVPRAAASSPASRDTTKPLSSQLEAALKDSEAKASALDDAHKVLEALRVANAELEASNAALRRELTDKDETVLSLRKELAQQPFSKPKIWEDAERTAQMEEALKATQALLEAKEKKAATLRATLETLRNSARAQRELDLAEIASLQDALRVEKDNSQRRWDEMAEKMEAQMAAQAAAAATVVPDNAVDAEEVEAVLSAKTEQINGLTMQLEIAKAEIDQLHRAASMHNDIVHDLQHEILAAREEAAPRALERDVAALKQQLKVKEGKVARLKRAIQELNAEMVNVAVDTVKSTVVSGNTESAETAEKVDAAVSEYAARVEHYKSENGELIGRNKKLSRELSAAKKELAEVKDELEAANRTADGASAEVRSLHAELSALKSKGHKNKAAAQTAASVRIDELETEVAELKAQLHVARAQRAPVVSPSQRTTASRRSPSPPTRDVPSRTRPATAAGVGGGGGGVDEGESGKGSGVRRRRPGTAPASKSKGRTKRSTGRTSSGGGSDSGDTSTNNANRPPVVSPSTSAAATAEWKAKKRWQRRTETLKAKLTEATTREAQTAQLLQSARDAAAAADRERNRLAAQLASLKRDRGSVTRADAGALADLQAKLYAAQGESADVREELATSNARVSELESLVSELQTQIAEADVRDREKETLRRARAARGTHAVDEEVADAEAAASAARKECDELKAGMLTKDREIVELRFQLESARTKVPRMEGRIAELESVVALYKDSTPAAAASIAASVSGRASGREGGSGVSGSKTRDHLQVIAGLERAVEKLTSENAALRKTSASAVDYVNLSNENKRLKAKVSKLTAQAESMREKEELMEKIGEQATKLSTESEKWRAKATKLERTVARLRKELAARTAERDVLAGETEERRRTLVEVQESNVKNTIRREKVLDDQADFVAGELERKDGEVRELESQLTSAQRIIETYESEIAQLNENVSALTALNGGGQNTELAKELQKAVTSQSIKIERLESEVEQSEKELERLRRSLRRRISASTGISEERLEACEKYEQLVGEYEGVVLERDALAREAQRLTAEIAHFTPEFMHEVEDLKLNYSQAITTIKDYEQQLESLSRVAGVSFRRLTTPTKPTRGPRS